VGDCESNGMRVNITGPDTLQYTIDGLTNNIDYTVELRGRTGAGLGDRATAMIMTASMYIDYECNTTALHEL